MPESSLTLTRLFGNFKFMASTNSLILSEAVDVFYVPLLIFFYVSKDLKKSQISKNQSIVAYFYPLNLDKTCIIDFVNHFYYFFVLFSFFFNEFYLDIFARYFLM